METNDTTMALNLEQPRFSQAAIVAQHQLQFVNSNDFYRLVPAEYYSFYNLWVRRWLQWYDGYVPWVHGGQNALLSTKIATTLVNRAADSIFGGGVMFANSRKPHIRVDKGDGKTIGAALNFIANDWSMRAKFRNVLKRAIRYSLAGGFSLLKLNNNGTDLWVEACRADRFWADVDAFGKVQRCVCALSFYDRIVKNKNGDNQKYALIEERRYERLGLFGEIIPVIEYKMYKTGVQVQYFSLNENYLKWEDLPKDVRQAFKAEFGDIRLNEPRHIKGFEDLGVYMLKDDDISNVPQLNLGESLLANIMSYLYSYDFYYTCLNTDMYLARGRVLVPKPMQRPNATASGPFGNGLDDFLYTKVETMTTEEQSPVPIQFNVRADEWAKVHENLMHHIATGIGLSVSTLASYFSDGSNRTAREVSAEESATTLFVENKRRAYESEINSLLKAVLRYYGYVDDVEIRWSRAGMTNTTVLTDTLAKAVQSGLISKKKAHSMYNYDDDEEQLAEDYKLVEEEQAQQQNSLFGGFGD